MGGRRQAAESPGNTSKERSVYYGKRRRIRGRIAWWFQFGREPGVFQPPVIRLIVQPGWQFIPRRGPEQLLQQPTIRFIYQQGRQLVPQRKPERHIRQCIR